MLPRGSPGAHDASRPEPVYTDAFLAVSSVPGGAHASVLVFILLCNTILARGDRSSHVHGTSCRLELSALSVALEWQRDCSEGGESLKLSDVLAISGHATCLLCKSMHAEGDHGPPVSEVFRAFGRNAGEHFFLGEGGDPMTTPVQ